MSGPDVDEGDHDRPRVTVSLVTYQGSAWLPGCLDSLDAQTLRDVEVIVHDNASGDGSWELLRSWAGERPAIRLERLPRNLGFAAAHDLGIAAARGDHVLLLNQDVELDPGFLAAAMAAFERDRRIGSVQPRLRRLLGPGRRGEELDTTGLVMGRDRRAVSRDQGRPDLPSLRDAGPVWGVDGPAPLYRRAALMDARLPRTGGGWEVLDEDFFLYKEDVDLAWRLRLLGWRAWYEPAALGWHARGTGGTGATSLLDIARTNRSIGFEAKALSWRNQRLMQIKNEDPATYLRDLPWIARRELLSLGFILVFDPRRLRAFGDLARAAPAALRKRRYLRARLRRRRGPGPSLRRRAYEIVPAPLRAPIRATWDVFVGLRAGMSRGSLRRSLQDLAGPGRRSRLDGEPTPGEGRRRILVMDLAVPRIDVHAGDLTLFHYLRILRAAGLEVVYRPYDGRHREADAERLAALGVELLDADADLADWLALNGAGLEWVMLARPAWARRFLWLMRRRTRARILYLAHDLHALRERRRFEATGDRDALQESRRIAEVEGDLFRAVDAVLTFSPDEVDEIRRLAPRAEVRVVTPAFYQAHVRTADAHVGESGAPSPGLAERRGILFVGAYDHLPNRDAAAVLVREVMPAVWSEVPDAHVTLVGGHLTPEISALAGERVSVTGHVPDLEPHWRAARMMVAPLRFGSGVKGKVIASLEAGVPVVTTPVGNEGIGLRHGIEALIASDPAAIAEHVITLYADPGRAEGLADAGRQVLETRFSEDAVRRDLLAALGIGDSTA